MFAIIVVYFFLFFFFSSRRRHTRCSRDWSSDVCSSDLLARRCLGLRFATSIRVHMPEKKQRIGVLRLECGGADQLAFGLLQAVLLHRDVSEQVVTAVVFGVDPEFSPQLRHSFLKARLTVAVQVGECEKIVRLRYSVVLGDGFLEFLDRVVQGLRLSFAISTTEVNMDLCCISQPC